MFAVELTGGWKAGSVSPLVDAIDFFGDAANYGLSQFVLALAPIWRSRTAFLKGMTMVGYGLFVIGTAIWNLATGVLPEPATMGVSGFMALLANLMVAVLLYTYCNGGTNMVSVSLGSRKDESARKSLRNF